MISLQETVKNIETLKEELGCYFVAFDFYKLNLLEEKINTLFLDNDFDEMFSKETYLAFQNAYQEIKKINKEIEKWKEYDEKKKVEEYFTSISSSLMSYFSFLEENQVEFKNFRINSGKPRAYDRKEYDYHFISRYPDYQSLTLECFLEKTPFATYRERMETFAYYVKEAKDYQKKETQKEDLKLYESPIGMIEMSRANLTYFTPSDLLKIREILVNRMVELPTCYDEETLKKNEQDLKTLKDIDRSLMKSLYKK